MKNTAEKVEKAGALNIPEGVSLERLRQFLMENKCKVKFDIEGAEPVYVDYADLSPHRRISRHQIDFPHTDYFKEAIKMLPINDEDDEPGQLKLLVYEAIITNPEYRKWNTQEATVTDFMEIVEEIPEDKHFVPIYEHKTPVKPKNPQEVKASKTDKKEDKGNGKGNPKSTISKKSKEKKQKKQKEHKTHLEECKKKKAARKEKMVAVTSSNVQPVVKQDQPKHAVKIITKREAPISRKKLNKLKRKEWGEWNKKHIEEIEASRTDDGTMEMEYCRVPRKFKKRHSQSMKAKYAKYPKSKRKKGPSVNYYDLCIKHIEDKALREQHMPKQGEIKHVGSSKYSLVCITDGAIFHRIPRDIAETIMSEKDSKWKYTTKSVWKSARAKGTAGYGFNIKTLKEIREQHLEELSVKTRKRIAIHTNIIARRVARRHAGRRIPNHKLFAYLEENKIASKSIDLNVFDGGVTRGTNKKMNKFLHEKVKNANINMHKKKGEVSSNEEGFQSEN